ncbi:hypothetical protein ACQ859_16610 [Roseateles chitinivorans]|uniref:hypothetical protein n=1 Tax=Roseateles chitinivorans TaxID=2917965 RepID=UPI003D67ED66
MELDTVSYVFQSPSGTFTVKQRISGRWRVRIDHMPWDESFANAQEAVTALSRHFDVPALVTEWTAIGHFHTAEGRWACDQPIDPIAVPMR